MTTNAVERSSASAAAGVVDRLLVTVRDPHTRQYLPVGFLVRTRDQGYEFSYLRSALAREGFRPLPGLTQATNGTVRSADLFPVFAERVVSSRRPDRMTSMRALGLPSDAAPFEVLARSHGQRIGDTIELLPAPATPAGADVSFVFLTHGVRHLEKHEQDRIAGLRPGQSIHLLQDTGNPVNPRALLVTDEGNVRLGWVPDPLIGVMEALTNERLVVERANGPEIGFHFRLLVSISGTAPADDGLFAGPEWMTR